MPKIKLLFFKISLLFFFSGLASCSPGSHFDYRTSRKAENFYKADLKGPAVPMPVFAAADDFISEMESDHQNSPANGLTPKTAHPVLNYDLREQSFPIPAKSLPPALVSPEGKEIIISRQEWKRAVHSIKGQARRKAALQQKGANLPASPAQNPLNQGILAGLLILGLGAGIILLGSLLPVIGTIVGWVLGVLVLLIGIAFLALTLAGFSVRIIG